MAQAMIMRRGGSGGGSTNLKVSTYSSALLIPANGSSDLIEVAVVTTTAIPEGGVMIASSIAFPIVRPNGNALQTGDFLLTTASIGNNIFYLDDIVKVPCVGAYQWSGTAWAIVPAKVSVKGAAYDDIMLLFYYLGQEYTSLTGGWTVSGAVKNVDNIYVAGSGSGGSPGATARAYFNLIDVTDLSVIHVISKKNAAVSGGARLNISTNITSALLCQTSAVAYLSLSTNTTNTEQTLDVSALSGLFYISLSAYTATSTIGSYVYKVWAE